MRRRGLCRKPVQLLVKPPNGTRPETDSNGYAAFLWKATIDSQLKTTFCWRVALIRGRPEWPKMRRLWHVSHIVTVLLSRSGITVGYYDPVASRAAAASIRSSVAVSATRMNPLPASP
jgi:hypothetical protein